MSSMFVKLLSNNLDLSSSPSSSPTTALSGPNASSHTYSSSISGATAIHMETASETELDVYATLAKLMARQGRRVDVPRLTGFSPSGLSSSSLPLTQKSKLLHSRVARAPYPNSEATASDSESLSDIPAQPSPTEIRCINCATTTTPLWRRTPEGKGVNCNACGLYLKVHGRPRPLKLRAQVPESDSELTDGSGGPGYRRRGPGKNRAKTRSRPATGSSPLSATPPSLTLVSVTSSSTSSIVSTASSAPPSPPLSASPTPPTTASSAETSNEGCSNCGTPNSPLWRRGKDGLVNCNACGLFWKTHGRVRPIPSGNNSTTSLTRSGASSDHEDKETPREKEKERTVCSNCQTPHSTLWRKDPEGKVCCNACGLHVRKYGVPKPVAPSKEASEDGGESGMDVDNDEQDSLSSPAIKRRNRRPRHHHVASKPYPSSRPTSKAPSLHSIDNIDSTQSSRSGSPSDPRNGVLALLEAARGLDMAESAVNSAASSRAPTPPPLSATSMTGMP